MTTQTIHLSNIRTGYADVAVDGIHIGIVENVLCHGQIIHEERDGTRWTEVEARHLWVPVAAASENSATHINRGLPHLDEGHATRAAAVAALIDGAGHLS